MYINKICGLKIDLIPDLERISALYAVLASTFPMRRWSCHERHLAAMRRTSRPGRLMEWFLGLPLQQPVVTVNGNMLFGQL
jgi:hypothetical protein